MSMRSRSRARREGPKANIDMNSLIDLTFLLLVVFIVTLPTLENNVPIILPSDKAAKEENKKLKLDNVNVDATGKLFIGDVPTTHEQLKEHILKRVAEDPEEYTVIVRGDVRATYEDVYAIFRIVKDCNVKHLSLASKDDGSGGRKK